MSILPPVVTLDLPAEASAPAAVRGALCALARSCPTVHLGDRELLEICGAVQEAVTNVIRHALRGDASRRFRVEMHRRVDAFEVVVLDDGPSYNLCEPRPPEPEEMREGGYGVHIMHSWADEVLLERVDGVNRLRLVRNYRAAAEGVA